MSVGLDNVIAWEEYTIKWEKNIPASDIVVQPVWADIFHIKTVLMIKKPQMMNEAPWPLLLVLCTLQ